MITVVSKYNPVSPFPQKKPKRSKSSECIKAYNRWMKEDVEDLMSDAFPEKTIWKAAWAAAMKHKENK